MKGIRTQRGSAYLYVIVCVSVMGLLAVELIPFINQARSLQARRWRKAKADFAAESLMQQVEAEALAQPIIPSSTRSLTLNGATSSATLTDGSPLIGGSYLLTGTTTIDGQAFRLSRYISQGIGTSAFNFALYSASDMNWSGKIVTGASGADGDVYCKGKIDLSSTSASTINGSISAKSTVQLASGSTVTGSTLPGVIDVAMPAFSSSTYSSNANYFLYGPVSSTTGVTFIGTINGHYPIYYISGDISFQGPITGSGVVFVSGNVTLTGNVTYANSSSRVAMIATGNVTANAGCSQIAGIYLVGGNLVVNSPDLNLTKGVIVANKISSGAIIRVTRDNFSQTSTTEGYKLCLPGYWP